MFPGWLLRISQNALGKPHYRGMAVYSSELWDEIRGKLSMFPGGSVNLVKQESGIAVLTVNNPDRMNAFSGTLVKMSHGDSVPTVFIQPWNTLTSGAHLLVSSGTMMLELQDRVSQLENWKEGKGLIVHGAGGTFCSGSDLNAVRAISNPQVCHQLISQKICVMSFSTAFTGKGCPQVWGRRTSGEDQQVEACECQTRS